jgi:signal transduction histidine kinase
MLRKLMFGVIASTALAFSTAAITQDKFGTADEAKAMLTKAIAAVKADKAKALDMFNKGEGGFHDRDLYPFCGNATDGTILAVFNPAAKPNIGKDVRTLKDATGKEYGKDLFAAGQKPEGQISEVSYMFPRPGETQPSPKVSFVTKIGDLYCGVGYYK